METKHIEILRCHMSELVDEIKDYHKKYGNTPGIEISIRYGTDHTHVDPTKVCVCVAVSKTNEKSLYHGSHSQHYHQEFIPAEV